MAIRPYKLLQHLAESAWNADKEVAPGLFDAMVKQPISDAYWSVTHPLDRMTGKGRASNSMMAVPMGEVPGMPGYQIVRASPGELYKTYAGHPDYVPAFSRKEWYPDPEKVGNWRMTRGRAMKKGTPKERVEPVSITYNALDPEGNPVGSLETEVHPHKTYYGQAWVDEELRKSPIFAALAKASKHRGYDKPASADFANYDLGYLMLKLAQREGRPLAMRQEMIDEINQIGGRRRASRMTRRGMQRDAERDRAEWQGGIDPITENEFNALAQETSPELTQYEHGMILGDRNPNVQGPVPANAPQGHAFPALMQSVRDLQAFERAQQISRDLAARAQARETNAIHNHLAARQRAAQDAAQFRKELEVDPDPSYAGRGAPMYRHPRSSVVSDLQGMNQRIANRRQRMEQEAHQAYLQEGGQRRTSYQEHLQELRRHQTPPPRVYAPEPFVFPRRPVRRVPRSPHITEILARRSGR